MLLDALHLTKSFPGVRALDDVDVSLREGEVHAIVGENGAGKSTLVNVLAGMTRPDAGIIRVDSREVVLRGPADAQRLGIAVVPQEIDLVPGLTVMENVFLGIEPRTLARTLVDWREMERRTRTLLARLGAAVDPRATVQALSTAQRQLVQLARAFAAGARVLILDEPTASLTRRDADDLFRIARNHRASGGSVLYVSHRLGEVEEIADRITVLRDGRKVAQLEAREATVPELIRHMVGPRAEPATEVRRTVRQGAPTVLEVRGLTRRGEFSDVSFELREGEILGIAGLVGAGRTELARCIFGDSKPDAGSVSIDGKEVTSRSPRQGIRNGIAYVPEDRRRLGLFPALSVAENMTLPILRELTGVLGIDRRRQGALVDDQVARLRIKGGSAWRAVRDLSGGNQQKVVLARWLLHGCRILILDEPTRGVDVNAKREIHALLHRVAGDGGSVILISSELEEIIEHSDRILVLHEGRIKGQLDPGGTTPGEIISVCLS